MPTSPEIIENNLMKLLKSKQDSFTQVEWEIILQWIFLITLEREMNSYYCDLPSRGY